MKTVRRPYNDLTGKTFQYLHVLCFDHFASDNRSVWKVQCVCGATKLIRSNNLKRAKSCGCKSNTVKTHGMRSTREYSSWRSMMKRCYDKNHVAYHRYGGSGITVCDRWIKFENFFEDMGFRPHGTSLDRINPYGGYEKSNCRWSDAYRQAENKKCGVYKIKHNNKIYTVTQLAKELGVDNQVIYYRIKNRKLQLESP